MSIKNLIKRAPVTLIGIPSLIGLTLYTQHVFLVFFSIAGILILNELYGMLRRNGTEANVWMGFPLYLLIGANQLFGTSDLLAPLLIGGILLLLTLEMFRKKTHALENTAVTFFGAAFTAFSMSAFILLKQIGYVGQGGHAGGCLVLTVFIGVWACDTLAYFVGSAIGKHKIFPRVSPNKSWEGSLSGTVGAILAMFLIQTAGWIPDMNMQDVLVLGGITGVAGQIGAFAESLVKRDVGVKDSSNLLPGHGGAWDRLDSILFAAPLSYYYLTLLRGF